MGIRQISGPDIRVGYRARISRKRCPDIGPGYPGDFEFVLVMFCDVFWVRLGEAHFGCFCGGVLLGCVLVVLKCFVH